MVNILDGNKISEEIKLELKKEIDTLNIKPRLDVILVGDNEASKIYVRRKCLTCKEVGIISQVHLFDEVDELNVKVLINRLNSDKEVNGILVQLPLPKTWNSELLFDILNPEKDVDVFNPINVGLLVQNRHRFLPPTPHAIRILLNRSGIHIADKHICIINRSSLIGRPLSSMLIQDNDEYANATVSVCHDRTPFKKLCSISKSADIIVVAVGITGFLTKEMVSSEQVVIDVGVSRINNKIVGDVDPEVYDIVKWVSKSVGGVGPLTVCMLLQNTLLAYKLQNNI